MLRRRMFLALGVVAVAVAIWLLIPFVRQVRESALRSQCAANLRPIALAVNGYYDRYHVYPPAYVQDDTGNRLHSWRVLILPFLDEQELYDTYRFDEPWNSPHNRQLIDRMPAVYGCPADTERLPGVTNYCAVVSSVAGWPEHIAASVPPNATSQTIMLVESCNADIPWLEPRDLNASQAADGINTGRAPGICSRHGASAICAFFDTSTVRLADDTNADVLFALLTASSGEPRFGLPFPKDLAVNVGSPAPVVEAEEFAATDVLPFLSGSLQPGRNYVYCATFPLAWEKATEAIGVASIRVEGATDFARQLAATRFPETDLNAATYIAVAERKGPGMDRLIREQLNARFPDAKPPTFAGEGVMMYVCLEGSFLSMATSRSIPKRRATCGSISRFCCTCKSGPTASRTW